MPTSIDGLDLHIRDFTTFVLGPGTHVIIGVDHNYFFHEDPDGFVVGIDDITTGESWGNVSASIGGQFAAVFDNITVDYSGSTAPLRIDLEGNLQHGGFAEGDILINVFSIIGSQFSDVIRGTDITDLPGGWVVNDPGANSLFGGGGDDILEGRDGPDLLNGGTGSDTASYEFFSRARFRYRQRSFHRCIQCERRRRYR